MGTRPSLRPGKIGQLKLKNRIIYPPMVSNFCAADGSPTPRYIEYMAERARGGCGLLITEATMITPEGRSFPNQLGIHDDALLDPLRGLTTAIHEAGAKIAVQLYTPGRQTSRAICGQTPRSPSPVIFNGEETEELTEAEILAIIKAYGESAARAVEAGFDAVEVHGGNGYLLQQFHSRFTNRREDAWGGSLGNRIRFSQLVLREIRKSVPEGFPIILRLGMAEDAPDGLAPEEGAHIARLLAREAIDALDITAGMRECGYLVTAPASLPVGTHLGLARLAKEACDLPIIGLGRILTLDDADRAIDDGAADFLIMGRAQIADPWLVRKSQAGRERHIIPCLGCNEGCMNNLARGLPISCAINPSVGHEGESASRAGKVQKIVVVGGGPAGCAAALAAEEAGHEVVLIEREGEAGGRLGKAALPPHKGRIGVYRDYLRHRLKNSRVRILKGNADAGMIMELGPDRVILATGGKPAVPHALATAPLVHAEDILEMDTDALPHDILILGGGLVGAECAEKLAQAGKNATIIEMRDGIALDVEPRSRMLLLRRLAQLGVQTLAGCRVEAIKPDAVWLECKNGRKILPMPGLLVAALGYVADDSLAEELAANGIRPIIVGDAKKPRGIMDAVHEGRAAGAI